MDYFRLDLRTSSPAGSIERRSSPSCCNWEEEHEIAGLCSSMSPLALERFLHLLDEGAGRGSSGGAPSRLRKPSEVASAPPSQRSQRRARPLPVPQAMPNSRADAAQPMSSAALDKLRRELRKLPGDAPALTTALVSAGLGEAGLLGDKQVDSVYSALSWRSDCRRDADPRQSWPGDPEQGSAASQLLCLVLPLATDLESVLPPAAAAGRAPETLVLPLRTATFAEAAMARLDDRRAEFIPGRLCLAYLRRILMPAVAHAALIDPDGRELADALVRSLRTEHQPRWDATSQRCTVAHDPGRTSQRQVLGKACGIRSRPMRFSASHAICCLSMTSWTAKVIQPGTRRWMRWQTVRDKLPAVLLGLRRPADLSYDRAEPSSRRR